MSIFSDYVIDIIVELLWFLCWLFVGYIMYGIYGSCHDLFSYLVVDEYMD